MKKKLGNNGEPIESEEYRDIKFDEMKEKPQPQESPKEWEEEFDKLPIEAGIGCSGNHQEIKSFTRTLLEAQKKEIADKIEKEFKAWFEKAITPVEDWFDEIIKRLSK